MRELTEFYILCSAFDNQMKHIEHFVNHNTIVTEPFTQTIFVDWKKEEIKPVFDKMLLISDVLGVAPINLLSGSEKVGNRSDLQSFIRNELVDKAVDRVSCIMIQKLIKRCAQLRWKI